MQHVKTGAVGTAIPAALTAAAAFLAQKASTFSPHLKAAATYFPGFIPAGVLGGAVALIVQASDCAWAALASNLEWKQETKDSCLYNHGRKVVVATGVVLAAVKFGAKVGLQINPYQAVGAGVVALAAHYLWESKKGCCCTAKDKKKVPAPAPDGAEGVKSKSK